MSTENRLSLSQEEILANRELFFSNVYNFILNADKILSDSRYFLASVGFHTAYNYSFTPCLGAFVEWWKYCYQYSWDAKDFPICHISGSPLTGTNFSKSIDLEGNLLRAKTTKRFFETANSFLHICYRYLKAQEECETYPLDFVLTNLPIKM